jgi:hypothetical protein
MNIFYNKERKKLSRFVIAVRKTKITNKKNISLVAGVRRGKLL